MCVLRDSTGPDAARQLRLGIHLCAAGATQCLWPSFLILCALVNILVRDEKTLGPGLKRPGLCAHWKRCRRELRLAKREKRGGGGCFSLSHTFSLALSRSLARSVSLSVFLFSPRSVSSPGTEKQVAGGIAKVSSHLR